MTSLTHNLPLPVRRWHGWHASTAAARRAAAVFAGDVGRGLLVISHNAFAVIGLVTGIGLTLALGQPSVRQQLETTALDWLQGRQEQRDTSAGNVLPALAEPDAVQRATAADIKSLPAPQARLAGWIARRYKVAPEPVGALVREAWAVGPRAGVDQTLILAVMAVESRFNPFAQSPVGAQGLMQVMTRVHDDKYESFGGTRAAFDPVANLRVGVQVLRDCIARAGGVAEGLRHYVGAALLDSDGGYAARVLAEQQHMQRVVAGRAVPVTVPVPRDAPALLRAAGDAAPPAVVPARAVDRATPSAPDDDDVVAAAARAASASVRVAARRG